MTLWKDIIISKETLNLKVIGDNKITNLTKNKGYYICNKINQEILEFILHPIVIINPQLYPCGDLVNIKGIKEYINKTKYKARFQPLSYRKKDIEIGKLFDDDAYNALCWLKN